jgi:hypothetical protein
MTRHGWIAALMLAACDAPEAQLLYDLSAGPAWECPSIDCNEIPMTCASWLSIRVLDPNTPQTPYYSQCTPVQINGQNTLCSIASTGLERRALPLRDLEVQVAVFPDHMITIDPETLEPVCPSNISYDANGFPVASAMGPSLGGRSFYHPGDDAVHVVLGCTNLEALDNEMCVGMETVLVKATVDDFETRVSVGQIEANRLSLAVGEPRASGTEFELTPSDQQPLERKTVLPPSWAADIDGLFQQYACLAVLDDAPQSTTTLTCQTASVLDETIDFTSLPGVRLTKPALDQILAALSLVQFPPEGLTIGIVLDVNGNPRQGIKVETVSSDPMITPTIRYLSSDRTTAGGTLTSGGQRGGVFVSTDAPFGTVFSAKVEPPFQQVEALGGRIAGKVTIVVLQFSDPIIGG